MISQALKNVYINQYNPAGERCLLPLAAGLLTAFVRNDSFLKDSIRAQINILRRDPVKCVHDFEDPFLLGFSVYVWNLQHSLTVARLAKERFPKTVIVFGGPSVPRYDDDIRRFFYQNRCVDILVHGEGELTFAALLRALLNNSDLKKVQGISFRSEDSAGGFHHSEPRQRLSDLSVLPSPFLTGVFDELLLRHRHVITGTIWETNRGCPFSCSFCDWGQATQSRVMTHEQNRLLEELHWISRNEMPYIFSADANFGIKERDLEIAQYMGRLHKTAGFPRYMQVNWMKNSHRKTINIADALKESGMGFQVTLSMQSMDKETLAAIKRDNIDLETFASLKKEYNQRGIDTYSELLLGLPGETYESFTNGLMKVLSPLPTDHFALYLIVVLPNAEMAKPEYREKFGIVTRFTKSTVLRQRTLNRDIVEIDETVVGTKAMPTSDWCRAFRFGYLLRMLHNMKVAFHILEFLREHYGISAKVFLEFLIESAQTTSKAPSVAEILTHLEDYINSILSGGDSMLALEDYPDYYWEPHEMCFLVASKVWDGLYRELEVLAVELVGQKIGKGETQLVKEVCLYQKAVSPLNKNKNVFSLDFSFDHAQYFESVFKNINGIEIIKRPCRYEFVPVSHEYEAKEGIDYLLAAVRACASGSMSHGRIRKIEDSMEMISC